jgi:hypothetical protein
MYFGRGGQGPPRVVEPMMMLMMMIVSWSVFSVDGVLMEQNVINRDGSYYSCSSSQEIPCVYDSQPFVANSIISCPWSLP